MNEADQLSIFALIYSLFESNFISCDLSVFRKSFSSLKNIVTWQKL